MMQRKIMVPGALALFCALASAIHAQTTYTISGTVTWKGDTRNGGISLKKQ